MKRRLACLIFAAIPLAAGMAWGKACKNKNIPSRADNRQKLVQAIESLDGQENLVFDGKMTQSELEQNQIIGGAGVRVHVNGMEMGGGYQGPYRVWLTPDGETVVASTKRLPGLLIYDNGDESIIRAQYRDTPISAGVLASELPGLLNLHELKRFVSRSKEVTPVADKPGTFRFDIPKRSLAAGEGGPFQGSISDAHAEITLSESGEITAIHFSITREQRSFALNLGQLGRGGAFVLPGMPGNGDDEEEEKKEKGDKPAEKGKKDDNEIRTGATMVYELTVSKTPPTPEMKSFVASVRKQLEEE